MFGEQRHLAIAQVRGNHLAENRQRDPWFMAERRDPAITRIEEGLLAGRSGEGVVATVVVANSIAETPVTRGAPKTLDPAVLIRRHRLCGQLAANPVRLFRQDNRGASLGRRQRRRKSAHTSANNQDIGLQLSQLDMSPPTYLQTTYLQQEAPANSSTPTQPPTRRSLPDGASGRSRLREQPVWQTSPHRSSGCG